MKQHARKMVAIAVAGAVTVIATEVSAAVRTPAAYSDSAAQMIDTRTGDVADNPENALDTRTGSWADSRLGGLNTTKLGVYLIIR